MTMEMKEKLVEIFCSVLGAETDFSNAEAMEFVEELIANGVTVQEWISVKDRLPDDLVNVLTCDAKGNIHMMWHHHDFAHPFNVGRNDLRYYTVTHWMPLPPAPKGE